jgi:hypothetical protein
VEEQEMKNSTMTIAAGGGGAAAAVQSSSRWFGGYVRRLRNTYIVPDKDEEKKNGSYGERMRLGVVARHDWTTTTTINHHHHHHQHKHNWCIERMYADCAGFVRNVLCSVMDREEFTLTKSDRDFMRAKDFFNFFRRIVYAVDEPTSTTTTTTH